MGFRQYRKDATNYAKLHRFDVVLPEDLQIPVGDHTRSLDSLVATDIFSRDRDL